MGKLAAGFFWNVAVAQGVVAASVGMAGAILILVFGNQFLDWRWLALIAAVTFPLAFIRTARRVPTPYRVAQIVDERLALRDSLSTALYFSEIAESRRSCLGIDAPGAACRKRADRPAGGSGCGDSARDAASDVRVRRAVPGCGRAVWGALRRRTQHGSAQAAGAHLIRRLRRRLRTARGVECKEGRQEAVGPDARVDLGGRPQSGGAKGSSTRRPIR